MHQAFRVFSVTLVFALMAVGMRVDDQLPQTFGECILRGGTIRLVDGKFACRYVETSTRRTYARVTTECGEEVDVDFWDTTWHPVVTYLFEPGLTKELPPRTDPDTTELPLPCLHDPESAGD